MTDDLQKVKDLLILRNCSNRTISSYLSCINRFKQFYKRKNLELLNEDDILDYLKKIFLILVALLLLLMLIVLQLSIMDCFLTEIKRIILDFVDYLYLEF